MKLVLGHNQTERFVSFFHDLEARSGHSFEYAPYDLLLFEFGAGQTGLRQLATRKSLSEYDGVYINNYLDNYELAAATATCCQALGVSFVNHELAGSSSLSKLTSYARLAKNGVSLPATIAGTKRAILAALAENTCQLGLPVVLKRADADRGVDNFLADSFDEIPKLLASKDEQSLWLLQEFIPNDGYYLVSFYDGQPAFCIFRSLEPRPDGDRQKAHFYRPKGGINASLVELTDVPEPAMDMARRAMKAMDRQIGSVDLLFDPGSHEARILEVNYNPQLVTIDTFKDIRIQAFLDGISKIA